jgi:hypothetical protein
MKSHNLKLDFLVPKNFRLTRFYCSVSRNSLGQGKAVIIPIARGKMEGVAENLVDLKRATSGIMEAWK